MERTERQNVAKKDIGIEEKELFVGGKKNGLAGVCFGECYGDELE